MPSRYKAWTNPWTHDRDRPVIRAIARRPTRSARRRRTRAGSGSPTGPFLGAATNRRPQPRERNVGVPEVLTPFRTTWVAEHRGHGGVGPASVADSLIRAK